CSVRIAAARGTPIATRAGHQHQASSISHRTKPSVRNPASGAQCAIQQPSNITPQITLRSSYTSSAIAEDYEVLMYDATRRPIAEVGEANKLRE
ncbi:hypothetical protein FALBO_17315, partial [Fusarium albosuccineum]